MQLDYRLNVTDEEKTSLETKHIPHGVPAVLNASEQLHLLQQEDYVLGYSEDFLMPKWVAFSPANHSV